MISATCNAWTSRSKGQRSAIHCKCGYDLRASDFLSRGPRFFRPAVVEKVTFGRFFRLTVRALALRFPRCGGAMAILFPILTFPVSRILWLCWDYCFRPVRD